jgi:hypothetical protein
MYLASHMTPKKTQVSSVLLAATPLSIFYIHPIESSQVVAVELHLCMRLGDRESSTRLPSYSGRSHIRVYFSGFDKHQHEPGASNVTTAYQAPGPLCFASDSARKRKNAATVAVDTTQRSPEYYSHPLDITHHQLTGY